jgi:hypothetical protein
MSATGLWRRKTYLRQALSVTFDIAKESCANPLFGVSDNTIAPSDLGF